MVLIDYAFEDIILGSGIIQLLTIHTVLFVQGIEEYCLNFMEGNVLNGLHAKNLKVVSNFKLNCPAFLKAWYMCEKWYWHLLEINDMPLDVKKNSSW